MKILLLLLLFYVSIIFSQLCPDHKENSGKYNKYSIYLTEPENVPNPQIHIYHSEEQEVEHEKLTKKFFEILLEKLKKKDPKPDEMNIFTFSDKNNRVFSHHKSIVFQYSDGTGVLLTHSFPSMHEYFGEDGKKGDIEVISIKFSQHLVCITLKEEDFGTLGVMYNTIRPFSRSRKQLFTPNEADLKQVSEACVEGEKALDKFNNDDIDSARNSYLQPTSKCIQDHQISQFTFYTTPIRNTEYFPQPEKVKEKSTVHEYKVDFWWKVAKFKKQRFLVVSWKGRGPLGSVHLGDSSVINFNWYYGDREGEKSNLRRNPSHEKIGIRISGKDKEICFGDGNRHFTQNRRPGWIVCITEAGIMHNFLMKRNKIMMKEKEKLIPPGDQEKQEKEYHDFVKQYQTKDIEFLDTDRAFVFDFPMPSFITIQLPEKIPIDKNTGNKLDKIKATWMKLKEKGKDLSVLVDNYVGQKSKSDTEPVLLNPLYYIKCLNPKAREGNPENKMCGLKSHVSKKAEPQPDNTTPKKEISCEQPGCNVDGKIRISCKGFKVTIPEYLGDQRYIYSHFGIFNLQFYYEMVFAYLIQIKDDKIVEGISKINVEKLIENALFPGESNCALNNNKNNNNNNKKNNKNNNNNIDKNHNNNKSNNPPENKHGSSNMDSDSADDFDELILLNKD